MMQNTDIVQRQLLSALHRRLLPWLQEPLPMRLLLAEPRAALPPGVTILERRPPLPSVPPVNASSFHGYEWPDRDMQTMQFIVISFILEGEAHFAIGPDPDRLLADGSGKPERGVEVLAVPERTLMALPAGVARTNGRRPHWERPGSDPAYSNILWIQSTPSGACCHLCQTRAGTHGSAGTLTVEDRQIAPICEIIIEELRTRGDHYEQVVCSMALGLLRRIERALYSQFVLPGMHLTQMRLPLPHASPLVQTACRFIQLYCKDPLTLADIARQHHLSTSQLNRRFRAEVGMSILKYVNHCRVEMAKRLLIDDGFAELTYPQVGAVVGIPDLSYFCRVFKATVGMTPRQFRESCLDASRGIPGER